MIDRFERLINLVIALRETRRALTVDDINQRVAGYEGVRDESWRRRFERDKAELRELGIPLRTESHPGVDDVVGYRIDPDDYDLPSLQLSPAQLTALALAVQLTGLGDDATVGLSKVAFDADPSGDAAMVGRLPLGMSLDAPNLGVLSDAATQRRRVRFRYRRAGDAEADGQPRRVEPHALLRYRGRWYLRGHDLDRDADRTFRLDRIVGDVRATGEAGAFQAPAEPPDPRVVVPDAPPEPVDAVVRASSAVAWSVARRARGAGEEDPEEGWRRFVVRVTDPTAFRAWLLPLGPEVEVLGPPDLRASVVAHLRALADLPGGGR